MDMSRQLMLAVCVFSAVLVLSACGTTPAPTPQSSGSTNSVTSPAASPPSSSSAAKPSGPAKVGTDLKAGPWTFTVSEIRHDQTAPGMVKPAAGKEFMYVDVGLGNTGTTTLAIKPEDCSMKDSSGAVVKPFGQRQAYNAFHMSPLEPKYGTSTSFIYEVTPGTTGYVFTFAPEVDGTPVPLEVSVP
jgi:hypothetical protein